MARKTQAEKKAIFDKLGEKAETGQFSKKDREKYEYSPKFARDNYSAMKYAVEEGEARGEAKGRAEGEAQKSIQITLKMKQFGFDVSIICDMTGLSAEDVELLN